MDVSIIVPVFNKAELTRVCLDSVRDTLPADVTCEVIVIDNNSTDHTDAVLATYPWVKVVKNERNLGFAAANNQGARLATGHWLVLLNNDTKALPGWLGAMLATGRSENAGIVGARLLFPDQTLQHAGVVVSAERFGPYGPRPYHFAWTDRADLPAANTRESYQIVTAACMLTPRDLYLSLGGLDEAYWNGYEDVDYCFKVLRDGRTVVYEPAATVIHYESQSGPMRFSRVDHNSSLLTERWQTFPQIDVNRHYLRAGTIRRWMYAPASRTCKSFSVPAVTVIVHGDTDPGPDFAAGLFDNHAPVARIIWAAAVAPPDFPGVPLIRHAGALEALQEDMRVRGDRYVALVQTDTRLQPGWLDQLIEEIEWGGADIVGATASSPVPCGHDVTPLTADARCTLFNMAFIPQHETAAGFDTVHGTVADLFLRMLGYGMGIRSASRPVAIAGDLPPDAAFTQVHGASISSFMREDPSEVERIIAAQPAPDATRVKASIIMLSWNALQFTKLAVESIRQYTTMPYEIIIVDNGSNSETVDWLAQQGGMTVIFNARNRGFAGGCNQGIAAATGDFIVLLNNDVVVSERWLENLVEAAQRDPNIGVTAPRSNEIAGDQKLAEANYGDLQAMQVFAKERARVLRRRGYYTDRAIGFCLCIRRTVIEQIGGIDESFETGNFEDDDFCVRVRAAGYRIYVCDDSFIHHFGSASFRANSVDYAKTMHKNWARFAQKWGYPPAYPETGYSPQKAIAAGFDRRKHFVEVAPVRPAPAAPGAARPGADVVILGIVDTDADWSSVGSVARRFLGAFRAGDSAILAVACIGDVAAESVGQRLERYLVRAGLGAEEAPDIVVSDETDPVAWASSFEGARVFQIPTGTGSRLENIDILEEASPSALRRLLKSPSATSAR